MSGTSPKQLKAHKTGDACKSGNACRRNAQRSTATPTPTDGVAANPDQGRGQTSDRGSITIEIKSFGILENAPVENIAVAYCRQNAIERQLYRAITELKRLQEHRCLSHANTSETPPIDQN